MESQGAYQMGYIVFKFKFEKNIVLSRCTFLILFHMNYFFFRVFSNFQELVNSFFGSSIFSI